MIQHLTKQQAAVALAREHPELAQHEIAERLGVSRGTVSIGLRIAGLSPKGREGYTVGAMATLREHIKKGVLEPKVLQKLVGCAQNTVYAALKDARDGPPARLRKAYARNLSLSFDKVMELEAAAEKHGRENWRALARDLLDIVIDDDMFSAILDE